MRSSEIHKATVEAGEDVSLVTVKRTLSAMVKKGVLHTSGSGRSVSYTLSVRGRVLTDVDARAYISVDPDKRYGSSVYNFDLFPSFPKEIWSKQELSMLEDATHAYKEKTAHVSQETQKKELERLIIELSWKSSKIEGNTYTLLDTENLLLNNKPAEGKTQEETQMILNHKEAFHFVHTHKDRFRTLETANIEELHKTIVKDMNVDNGLRKNPVGISGSVYRPLDNAYQVKEALQELAGAVNRVETPYAKACLVLLGLSYIQPFEDGNKRTSRLAADAVLMANGCAPLSYRSVDEKEYKEATLVFYELNSIVPFKRIFVDQYCFSAQNYTVV